MFIQSILLQNGYKKYSFSYNASHVIHKYFNKQITSYFLCMHVVWIDYIDLICKNLKRKEFRVDKLAGIDFRYKYASYMIVAVSLLPDTLFTIIFLTHF